MNAGPLEMLRSERHTDGRTHAIYPTAKRTLCSRLHEEESAAKGQPTCGRCLTAAIEFRGIDKSAPASWVAA